MQKYLTRSLIIAIIACFFPYLAAKTNAQEQAFPLEIEPIHRELRMEVHVRVVKIDPNGMIYDGFDPTEDLEELALRIQLNLRNIDHAEEQNYNIGVISERVNNQDNSLHIREDMMSYKEGITIHKPFRNSKGEQLIGNIRLYSLHSINSGWRSKTGGKCKDKTKYSCVRNFCGQTLIEWGDMAPPCSPDEVVINVQEVFKSYEVAFPEPKEGLVEPTKTSPNVFLEHPIPGDPIYEGPTIYNNGSCPYEFINGKCIIPGGITPIKRNENISPQPNSNCIDNTWNPATGKMECISYPPYDSFEKRYTRPPQNGAITITPVSRIPEEMIPPEYIPPSEIILQEEKKATEPVPYFSDVAEKHDNFNAVQYMKELDIIGGYPNKTFQPGKNITRAEFTKILIESRFDKATIDHCIETYTQPHWVYYHFKDIPIDSWFAKYMCIAINNNILEGFDSSNMKPNNNITFVEAAKMIVEAYDFEKEENKAMWYKPYVEVLEEKKAIPLSIHNLRKPLTRGEVAEILYRVSAGINDKNSQSYKSLIK